MNRLGIFILWLSIFSLITPIMNEDAWGSSKVVAPEAKDKKTNSEPRTVAEKYWKSQKISDYKLYQSVTERDDMKVVFKWSFVRDTRVRVEETKISDDMRGKIQNMIDVVSEDHQKSAEGGYYDGQASVLESIMFNPLADKKAKTHLLGSSLMSYSFIQILPPNFAQDANKYKLMKYEYIADVEFQSEAGMTLKKRITTTLYRMVIDGHDSGWKVY